MLILLARHVHLYIILVMIFVFIKHVGFITIMLKCLYTCFEVRILCKILLILYNYFLFVQVNFILSILLISSTFMSKPGHSAKWESFEWSRADSDCPTVPALRHLVSTSVHEFHYFCPSLNLCELSLVIGISIQSIKRWFVNYKMLTCKISKYLLWIDCTHRYL